MLNQHNDVLSSDSLPIRKISGLSTLLTEVFAGFHAAAEMSSPKLHVFEDNAKIQSAVVDLIVAKAAEAEKHHGHFSIGLSGGSVSKIVSLGLRDRKELNWSSWHVFYCDERHVDFENQDSTHAFYKKEFFDHVPIQNIYSIDPTVTVHEASEDYVRKIRKLYPGDNLPTFDLLLLGMGPDGHTCSLFPDHPGLNEVESLVIPIIDSPKPPSCRITLTYPVLNNARCVAVISAGESKASAVKDCLEPVEGQLPLPAGRVRPTAGELHWFMDEGASSKLANK